MTENVTSETATSAGANPDWASLAGIILDGGCELKEVLEERPGAARLRARILGSGGRMGTAYFLKLAPKDAEDQLDIWEILREIQHPNLNRPLSVGRLQVGGADAIYMVLAEADEKLAAVVPERSLEWEEASEALQSIEKGLAQLHACGLVHGSVSPETVQAVGYSIQLDTESVRRLGTQPRVEWTRPRYLAPESKTANTTTAADVWCLGATLFEVLAQEPYGTPGAELEEGLPLGGVIARCLERNPATRCKLKEAPGFEESRVEAAAPKPANAVPQPEVRAAPKAPLTATPESGRKTENGVPEARKPATAEKPGPSSTTPAYTTPSYPNQPAPNQVYPTPAPTQPASARAETGQAEKAAPAGRPVDNRVPSGQAGMGTVNARTAPGPRLPHPLTPKPAARTMTKDEMALVPVGKRQKKVQGKRQGVSARIRTLDGPSIGLQEETAAWGGPSVVARVLAVGKKANFVRGIIAGVLLTGLFLAAVVFIIFPKLQSPGEPLISGESAQTPLAGGLAAPTGSVSQASGPPPSGSAVPGSAGLTTSTQEPNSLMPENSVLGKSTDAVPPMNASRPEVVPVKIERFHVVISAFATKGEALQHLDKLSQQHPDLFLQITTARTGTGERRYLVVVGGSLSRDQADQLRQRVQKKGLQGAQVVPSADNR